MTTVTTDLPLDEESDRHVEMLDRDLGLEALRDPDVRGGLVAPIGAFLIAAVFAYATTGSTSPVGLLVGVIVVSVATVFGVKWTDEALCVVRSGHTCYKCRSENERWEVGE